VEAYLQEALEEREAQASRQEGPEEADCSSTKKICVLVCVKLVSEPSIHDKKASLGATAGAKDRDHFSFVRSDAEV
jgi:hypothetical protein